MMIKNIKCNKKIRTALVVCCSLFGLSACGGSGGGSNDSPPMQVITDSNGISLLEAGSGSLEILTISQSVDVKNNIKSSSQQILQWGDHDETNTVNADFDVSVSLSADETEIQVSTLPLLNSYSEAELDKTEKLPGSGIRTYNPKGVFVEAKSNDADGLIAYNTQHLFSFPGLILAVPETAVGIGSKWQYELDLVSGKVVTNVHLEALGEDTLSVSMESVYSGNVSESSDYLNTLNAVYDKESLVIRSGTALLEVSQAIPISINGVASTYRATNRIIHTISRVAQ